MLLYGVNVFFSCSSCKELMNFLLDFINFPPHLEKYGIINHHQKNQERGYKEND